MLYMLMIVFQGCFDDFFLEIFYLYQTVKNSFSIVVVFFFSLFSTMALVSLLKQFIAFYLAWT